MSRTAVTVRTAPAIDASARREHRLCLRACRWPLPPAYTCSPLTAVLRSTHRWTAPPARPPAQPSSAARSPPPSPPPPAYFPTTPWSSRCCCRRRGSMRGSVELQGGAQGGSGGAAAGQLCSRGSGGPLARLRRLRRRFAARPRVSSASPGAAENHQASSHFFLDSISVCDAGVRRWIELTASFPTV